MKISRTNQAGASHLFALFAIAIILAIGAIGYKVTSMSKTPTDNATTTTTSVGPSTLRTKSDVAKANKDLDSVPVDADLDPAQLDSDISSLQ